MTAGLVKFSLAISSMFSCWRWRSWSMASAISGSTFRRRKFAGANCVSIFNTRRSWRPPSNLRGDEGIENFFGGFDGVFCGRSSKGRWHHCAGASAMAVILVLGLRRRARRRLCWRRCSCRRRWCRSARPVPRGHRRRPAPPAARNRDNRPPGPWSSRRNPATRQAALQQILLEHLLQFKAAVVRAEREVHGRRLSLPVCRPESCVVP